MRGRGVVDVGRGVVDVGAGCTGCGGGVYWMIHSKHM